LRIHFDASGENRSRGTRRRKEAAFVTISYVICMSYFPLITATSVFKIYEKKIIPGVLIISGISEFHTDSHTRT
jgi:hypothetical protein